METLPWIIALVALSLLGVVAALLVLAVAPPAAASTPLPTEWALSARPVFSHRRAPRLPASCAKRCRTTSSCRSCRWCASASRTTRSEVRYWYDLLGSIHVTFAVCSANGRVLAAIDLDTDRGNSRRVLQIKQSVLGACRVRYLRCPVDHLPSVAELQLLVPQQRRAGARAAAGAAADATCNEARDSLASTVAIAARASAPRSGRTRRFFQDSFFAPDSRADGFGSSEFASLAGALQPTRGTSRSRPAVNGGDSAPTATDGDDGGGVVVDAPRYRARARGTESARHARVRCAPMTGSARRSAATRRTPTSTPDAVLDALDGVGPARRRPAAAAQLLREPRLPGLPRRRPRRRRQVLSARALERRADPRGARVRRRAGRRRDPGRRAAGADASTRLAACGTRSRSAAPTLASPRSARACLPLRRLRAPRRPRARARRPGDAALARPLHRPPACGRRATAVRAPRSRSTSRASATPARDWLLAQRHRSRRTPQPALDAALRRGARRRRSGASTRPARRDAAPARRLPSRQRAVDRRAARTSSTSTTPCNGPAMQDLWMLLSGDRAAMARQLRDAARGLRGVHGLRLARAAPDRAAAHAAHDPPQRLDRAALERPGVPDRLPVVRRARPTGPSRARGCASSSRRCAEPPLGSPA